MLARSHDVARAKRGRQLLRPCASFGRRSATPIEAALTCSSALAKKRRVVFPAERQIGLPSIAPASISDFRYRQDVVSSPYPIECLRLFRLSSDQSIAMGGGGGNAVSIIMVDNFTIIEK